MFEIRVITNTIDYHLGHNIYTNDIVKLSCSNYLLGTNDTTSYTDKSFVLGIVRYSEDEARFRVKQITHGNFYKYSLAKRTDTDNILIPLDIDKLLPIYFYNLVDSKQMFSWDKLEVVGNVYTNNYPKESGLLSWY